MTAKVIPPLKEQVFQKTHKKRRDFLYIQTRYSTYKNIQIIINFDDTCNTLLQHPSRPSRAQLQQIAGYMVRVPLWWLRDITHVTEGTLTLNDELPNWLSSVYAVLTLTADSRWSGRTDKGTCIQMTYHPKHGLYGTTGE